MRVLWIAGDVPTGAKTGLQSYSRGLAPALAEAGTDVHGVGLAVPGVADDGGGVHWRPVPGTRRPLPRNLLSRWPNLTSGVATRAFVSLLDDTLAREHWDAVVLDHLQVGWAWDRVRRWRDERSPRTTLAFVTHNAEGAVRRMVARTADRSLPARAVLRFDATKADRLERRVVRGADVVTAITEDDARSLRAQRTADDILVLTPGYEGRIVTRAITDDVPRRAVVFGSFDWHVKLENLTRLVRAADPVFARAGAELIIAGRVPEGAQRELSETCRATTFLGFVPSVTETLQSCRIGIVSEPAGGGFKMKSLDYVFNGLAVAQLAGSLAGLPLDAVSDTIVAHDEASLASAITEALDDVEMLDRMQRSAIAKCAPRFSWSERGARLAAALADARVDSGRRGQPADD